MIDALRNPLVLGKKYGYCLQSSGNKTIVTGTLEKFNERRASLRVENTNSYLGENFKEPKKDFSPEIGRLVSIIPVIMFAI